MWRYILCVVIGGVSAILLAANWPDPSDGLAGALLGYIGTVAGMVVGIIWTDHARR